MICSYSSYTTTWRQSLERIAPASYLTFGLCSTCPSLLYVFLWVTSTTIVDGEAATNVWFSNLVVVESCSVIVLLQRAGNHCFTCRSSSSRSQRIRHQVATAWWISFSRATLDSDLIPVAVSSRDHDASRAFVDTRIRI